MPPPPPPPGVGPTVPSGRPTLPSQVIADPNKITAVSAPRTAPIFVPDGRGGYSEVLTQLVTVTTGNGAVYTFHSGPDSQLNLNVVGQDINTVAASGQLGTSKGVDPKTGTDKPQADVYKNLVDALIANTFGKGQTGPVVREMGDGRFILIRQDANGGPLLNANGDVVYDILGTPTPSKESSQTPEQAALTRAQIVDIMRKYPMADAQIAYELARSDYTEQQTIQLMQLIEQSKYAAGPAGLEATLNLFDYLGPDGKNVLSAEVAANAKNNAISDATGMSSRDKMRAAEQQKQAEMDAAERERARISANTLISDELNQNQEARANAVAQGTNTENYANFINRTSQAAIPGGEGGALVSAFGPVYGTQSQIISAANQRTPGAEAGRGFLMSGLQNVPPYQPYQPVFGGGAGSPNFLQPSQGGGLTAPLAGAVLASQDPRLVPQEYQAQLDDANTLEEFGQIYTAAQLGVQLGVGGLQ